MAPPSVYTYVSPVTVPVSSLNVSLLVSSSILASLLSLPLTHAHVVRRIGCGLKEIIVCIGYW